MSAHVYASSALASSLASGLERRFAAMDAREARRGEELAHAPARILSAAEAARRIAAGSPPSDGLIAAVRAAAVPFEAAFQVVVSDDAELACFAIVRAARGEARERVALPCGDAEWLAAFAALGLNIEGVAS